MNILQINGADQRGGAHEVGWSLHENLRRFGHNTSMFVDKKCSNDPLVFNFATPFYKKLLSRIFASDLDFFNSDQIIKTEQFKKADVVHCHNLHGGYFKLATLRKISKLKPIVWTLHDEWAMTSNCAHSFDGKQRNGFYTCPISRRIPFLKFKNDWYLCWKKKKIYEKTNFNIVSPSLWLQKRINGSILKDKKNFLIYNGIDPTVFKRMDKISSRKDLSLPLDKKIILFLAAGGSANTWKGWGNIENFLVDNNTFKNDNSLVVCLGGLEKKYSEKNTSGSQIISVPYIEDKNILAKYYSAADLFLLPSLADNFPLTVLEAMSCGLPVVSFDVGGVKEAVSHRINGYIAKYGNLDDIKNGIKYVFGLDKENYDKMSLSCQQRVKKNFSLDAMTNKYIDLYKQVIK